MMLEREVLAQQLETLPIVMLILYFNTLVFHFQQNTLFTNSNKRETVSHQPYLYTNVFHMT